MRGDTTHVPDTSWSLCGGSSRVQGSSVLPHKLPIPFNSTIHGYTNYQ